MPTLQAGDIYKHALSAGFPPEVATVMTAIALAESRGVTTAHASKGEDSRGLWQINLDAHPRYAEQDLFDPAVNARAAYDVWADAGSVKPWSVTHPDRGQPYLDYMDEARVAAGLAGGAVERSALDVFLSSATAQEGDTYVFGAETSADDDDPDTWDCSELVQWAAAKAGVEMPDGSWIQYGELQRRGAEVSVEEAIRTPGALLFRFSSSPTAGGRPSSAHVAISLGDGRTIEAKGRAYGVVYDDAEGRGFDCAAVIPGISDAGETWQQALSLSTGATLGAATVTPVTQPAAPDTEVDSGVDTDGDELTDKTERDRGLDPESVDTDGDGASDGYEVVHMKTDAAKADTDGDLRSDTSERVLGTDALEVDTDLDGYADGEEAGALDSDGDRLSDRVETASGTGVSDTDSDDDGILDGLEVTGGFDPLDPLSSPFAAAPAVSPVPAVPPASTSDALTVDV